MAAACAQIYPVSIFQRGGGGELESPLASLTENVVRSHDAKAPSPLTCNAEGEDRLLYVDRVSEGPT